MQPVILKDVNILHACTQHPFNAPSSGTRKVKPISILLKQRQWVAVASAELYENVYLALDRQHASPHHSVFAGQMPLLLPNQQC